MVLVTTDYGFDFLQILLTDSCHNQFLKYSVSIDIIPIIYVIVNNQMWVLITNTYYHNK